MSATSPYHRSSRASRRPLLGDDDVTDDDVTGCHDDVGVIDVMDDVPWCKASDDSSADEDRVVGDLTTRLETVL